jgi:hypothetical protein
MMLRALLVSLALLALAASACDDNGGGDALPEGANPPRGEPGSLINTGNDSLDYIVNTALHRDIYELAELTLYHHVGCEGDPQGADPGPRCRDGEDEGDEVEVFRLYACGGETWVRPESLPGALDGLVNREILEVETVHTPTDAVPGDADYVVVFRTTAESEAPVGGLALHAKEGRLYALECASDITGLLADDRVGDDVAFERD